MRQPSVAGGVQALLEQTEPALCPLSSAAPEPDASRCYVELKGLHQRIENIGYKMIIDDEAKRFVASKGYDIQFGARPLKRAIQNYLEDGLSEIILGTELQPGDTIKVLYNKEEDAISMTVEK